MKNLTIFLISFLLSVPDFASDWPMWRYDAGRSASSPEQLPLNLALQWSRHYEPREMVWDDPLNHDLMQYDKVFEPIVADGNLFIGFNDQDKVVAFNATTGKEVWTFYAEGPVRLPLAYHRGKILFTSDDGYLYCLSAGKGDLVWKLRGGPTERKILGNQRLISTWPARGGVVTENGMAYFAASIWPFMGTFIYAVEISSGNIIWKNDGTGAQYMEQPHGGAYAFASVAPQGSMVISGQNLLVPGGRSVPACFDKKTGELRYYHLNENNKTGGAFVCANKNHFINHFRDRKTFMYKVDDGSMVPGLRLEEYPVLDEQFMYFSGDAITARHTDQPDHIAWNLPVDASGDLIKAGSTLYAGGNGRITAIDVSLAENPQIVWAKNIDGTVGRLIAANGLLIAVTLEGDILAFGNKNTNPVQWKSAADRPKISAKAKQKADLILRKCGITEGYAVCFTSGKGDVLTALALNSKLKIIAVEQDVRKLRKLRSKFDQMGIRADRVAFIHGTPGTIDFAPYFSSVTIIEDIDHSGTIATDDFIGKAYAITRPFGGKIWLGGKDETVASFAKQVKNNAYDGLVIDQHHPEELILTRAGAPKGTANWTHQYGSMANTVKSDDELVKLPLGILWFGGNSNMDVLPRHGHGPPEQIMNGKLIIEGINTISARDVYTGRVLWKTEFTSLNTFGAYYNESYADDPLNPFYNQEHIPGANSRGTNFIVTPDLVYVLQGITCQVLDIETGAILKSMRMQGKPHWAYIGSSGSYLVAGAHFVKYSNLIKSKLKNKEEMKTYLENVASKNTRIGGMFDYDQSASAELVVMDRHSFEEKWRIKSNYGFIHNAIASNDRTLFCLDKMPAGLTNLLERRGIMLEGDYVLAALNLQTGDTIWQKDDDIFGSWLGYAEDHDILIQATRPSRDMLNGEAGERMIAYRVGDGSVLWDKRFRYNNPPILHGDKIIVEQAAYSLLTGDPIYRTDPITREEIPWRYTRTYGCNYNVGSEHLLSFRSGAAGFYDLSTDGGTGNFGGFKSGCTSNLIAANGVLNAPDYTRTCSCSYQNQTSLSFVHMPELEFWTYNDFTWSGSQVKQLGINFGAPGDRMSQNNTLWLDYPSEGGRSPDVPVKVTFYERDTANIGTFMSSKPMWDGSRSGFFRSSAYTMNSSEYAWVGASCVTNFSKIEIALANKPFDEASYTINLFFTETEEIKPGKRVFDLKIQGNTVLQGFDIVKEAGGSRILHVESFEGIELSDQLIIECTKGEEAMPPVLCGIEVILESENP